jgi:sugar lactone lactonase YvrE
MMNMFSGTLVTHAKNSTLPPLRHPLSSFSLLLISAIALFTACSDSSGPGTNIVLGPQYGWVVSTIAGSGSTEALNGGYANGAALTAARFNMPNGITGDAAGNLYVTDTANNRIRKIAPDGTDTTLAGSGPTLAGNGGYADGTALTVARCNQPMGITGDAAGNLYVADSYNHRIRKIANDGSWTVTTIAGSGPTGYGNGGYADGAALTVARFNEPMGITGDVAGNL